MYISMAISKILPTSIKRGALRRFVIDGDSIVAVDYVPTHISHRVHTWGTGENFSGGYEIREVLGVAPPDVLEGIILLADKMRAEAEASSKDKEEAEIRYEAWIASLPDQLDKDTVIDKHQRCLTDIVGNYLISLPTKPYKNLAEWAAERLSDFSGD
jgi:hypothetical protein